MSPTVAARELVTLEQRGLVERRERVVALGRARRHEFWVLDRRNEKWNAELTTAVRQVRLPAPREASSRPFDKIPLRFQHYFWNADLNTIDLERDASYLAGRLLAAPDVSAGVWALKHLPAADIRSAMRRRGVDERTRSFVANWQRESPVWQICLP